MKLVDTKDLKSLPFWECQFESGRGHQLYNKVLIVSDSNSKSLKIKKQILKRFNKDALSPNLIIVIGGDGFMLKVLKNIKIQKNHFME